MTDRVSHTVECDSPGCNAPIAIEVSESDFSFPLPPQAEEGFVGFCGSHAVMLALAGAFPGQPHDAVDYVLAFMRHHAHCIGADTCVDDD